MGKPIKEKTKQEFDSILIQENTKYTAKCLRNIADEMNDSNIEYIILRAKTCYDDCYIECCENRLETEEEKQERYKIELERYNNLYNKKQQLINEAKRFGLKLVEE